MIYDSCGYKNDIRFVYKRISDVHKSMSKYDSALYYYELYVQAKDSLFTEEKSKQIAELEYIYQTEKKNTKNPQPSVSNEMKWIAIMLLWNIFGIFIVPGM